MNVRSDLLLSFRALRSLQPALDPWLSDLPQWQILFDANALIQDVCHRAQLKNPDARTTLEELVASGTVKALTTIEVVAEVERHLPRHAARIGCDPDTLAEIWLKYRAIIEVDTPPSPGGNADIAAIRARDPEDEHLIAAAIAWNVDAIMTDDKDLLVTTIPVFQRPVLISMRDVARHTSTALAQHMGPPLMFSLAIAVLIDAARQLPAEVLVTAAAVIVVALAHPEVRKHLSAVGVELLQGAVRMMEESDAARARCEVALSRVASAGVRVEFGPAGGVAP